MKKQGVEGSRGRVIMKRRGFKGLIGKAKRSTPNPLNPRTLLLHSKGFTLIELIIIIILAGILVAAVAVKITLSPSQTASVTAVDQAVADIQYTQMLAFGNRSNRRIVFNSGDTYYTIQNSSISPAVTIETKKFPTSGAVAVTAGTTVTFEFNSLGELLLGTGCINASPSPSYCRLSIGGTTITVYCITGKVSVP